MRNQMTDLDHRFSVSKLDAARRQLRTAIRLWFSDGDPVAVHTLAFAAYEILHAVSKARNPGRDPLLFDSKSIKEEKRSEFNQMLKKWAYFFKHGDREPHGVIEFNSGLSEFFILYAVIGIQYCGESLGNEELAFLLWTQIHAPDALQSRDGKRLIDSAPANIIPQARAIPKHEFLEVYKMAQAPLGR
jgi:hypothetical protein